MCRPASHTSASARRTSTPRSIRTSRRSTGTYFANAELRHTGERWSWTLRGYVRRHDDRFELFREGDGYYRYSNGYFIRGEADTARFTPTFFYTYHNRHRTDVAGAEAQVKRSWKAGITSFGAHGRYEHIYSNVLGDPLATPVEAAGAREPFTCAAERRNLALTADHRYDHGRWTIDAGVLLNINSAFSPEWAPGADVVYRWTERSSTYMSAGRAFRFPTWTDLYYNRGGAVGSKDLRPEHADQIELGQRFGVGRVLFKASVWRRQGRDLIDWVVLPGETTTHAANLTEVDLNGVEMEATFTQGKGRGGALYAYQWADQTAFAFKSLYVLDHLTHNAVLWWQQPFSKGFRAQLNLTWRQRYGTYARFTDGALVDYPDPLRVDLRVDWTRGRVTVFASGYNLLDAAQMDRANVPLPGRWISGGVQLRWGGKARTDRS
ncbi:MAG: TonB-dependent receptor [Flavobacteriales bacterium]